MRDTGAPSPLNDDDPQWVADIGDDYDMPADVDASFRTVRKVAVGHFVVFLAVVVGMPVLTLTVDWWSGGRLIGGMSPSFVMAAFGLYVFFFALAAAAATLSNGVEERMLGAQEREPADESDDA
ncbi:hypothetical protein [Haloechinothrix salitolerans]|uniref:Solute:sodium symporter small subunit n=1 Tax=Haloechinothrix salitolerans TaxID=926830 RepID=A0ABW2BY57_9PSEU